jgi:hypothetical protein
MGGVRVTVGSGVRFALISRLGPPRGHRIQRDEDQKR